MTIERSNAQPRNTEMIVVTAQTKTTATDSRVDRFRAAYSEAMNMLCMHDGLEITSALKEAGAQNGIAWGDEMGEFVHYARQRMGW